MVVYYKRGIWAGLIALVLIDVAVTGYVGIDQECNGLMILAWNALGLPVILAFKFASVTALFALYLLIERYLFPLIFAYTVGLCSAILFLGLVVINNLLLVGG